MPKEPLKEMSPSKVWKQIETDHPYNTAECSTTQKVKQSTNKVKLVIQMASLRFHVREKKVVLLIKILQPAHETIEIERTLIMIDDLVPNDLLDNNLYYISGFIVRSLLPKLQCSKCKEALLLDPTGPMVFKMVGFPVYAKFTESL